MADIMEMTNREIDTLIEIGSARNIEDINRTMLDDTIEEKRGYLLELDESSLDRIIAEYEEDYY